MIRNVIILSTAMALAACGHHSSNVVETSAVAQRAGVAGSTVYDSMNSFDETESRLRAALQKRDLKIFTVVDHGEGAQAVGENIGQSKLFIFGNPKSGTPLILANRQLGLELPMKALVYTSADGKTRVITTDIGDLVTRYGVQGKPELMEKISGALRGIAQEATQ